MMMDGEIQVTVLQNEYLLALEDCPKVTRDFVLAFGVCGESVRRMVHKLHVMGLVVSSADKVPQHRLVRSYPELVAEGLVVGSRKYRSRIPAEEVEFVAQLRKEGWIGQRLTERYHERFPGVSANSVRYRVTIARARGLF